MPPISYIGVAVLLMLHCNNDYYFKPFCLIVKSFMKVKPINQQLFAAMQQKAVRVCLVGVGCWVSCCCSGDRVLSLGLWICSWRCLAGLGSSHRAGDLLEPI